MALMQEIEWQDALMAPLPSLAFEARFTRETGRPAEFMRFMTGNDWLSDTVIRLSVNVNTHVHLEADLVDEAGLVVSQDNSCRFCFGAQRAFLRILGKSEKRITRLEQDLLTGDFTARERAVLQFARRMSRSVPLVSESDVDAMRAAGFVDEEIAELAGAVAAHLFLNRLSTLLAIPPQRLEKFPDLWWARLARPLLAIKFKSMRRASRRVALTAEEQQGPFSEIVMGLDGLPIARELRIIVDAIFANSAMSPRAVPLIFAVVARALGSVASEREVTRILMERGLTQDQVAEILSHLSSPALDDVERQIIPLARETVWYEPSQIQRRCLELRDQLTREQLLEFIGVVSLANAICRLEVLRGSGE